MVVQLKRKCGDGMSLGTRIGRGNTAEVFELGDREVLKLFYDRIPFEYIEKEYETSRMIYQLGIPSPFEISWIFPG